MVKLLKGAHTTFEAGYCVMELSAYLAHETHSDKPACVSPVIAEFMRSWNDALKEEDRQILVPYAIKVIGTKTTSKDELARSWLAADWLVRVHTPAWLRLAGLTEHAQALEGLARYVDAKTATAGQATLDAARTAGAAAWQKFWDEWAGRYAAGYAARDAARYAASYAASDAASDAAGYAARDAARYAASYAARDAARCAARDAARDAASYAASYAASDAASDAASYAASCAALRPTAVALQQSALVLLDDMIAVGRVKAPPIDCNRLAACGLTYPELCG